MFGMKFLGFHGGAMALWLAAACRLSAQTDQSIYSDSLQNGWDDWGWAQINYSDTNFVHSGVFSISVKFTDNTYQAIYIQHPDFDSGYYSNLTFWINGGTNGGQKLQVKALLENSSQAGVALPTLATNSWQKITLSLASLGVANQPNLDGFWIQDRIGAAQPVFYVDEHHAHLSGTPPPVLSGYHPGGRAEKSARDQPVDLWRWRSARAGKWRA